MEAGAPVVVAGWAVVAEVVAAVEEDDPEEEEEHSPSAMMFLIQGRKPCTLAYTPWQCHQAIPHCSVLALVYYWDFVCIAPYLQLNVSPVH